MNLSPWGVGEGARGLGGEGSGRKSVSSQSRRESRLFFAMRSAVAVLFLLASTAVAFTPSAAWRPLPAPALRRADAPLLVDQAAPRADAPISDVELQVQSAKLDALSAKWEKREKEVEYAESLRSGWGPSPERINGRFAMFFLIVGLITEYYTGQSVPQQCYTMLQTLSIVDVRTDTALATTLLLLLLLRRPHAAAQASLASERMRCSTCEPMPPIYARAPRARVTHRCMCASCPQ